MDNTIYSPIYNRASLYGASLVASEFDDSNIFVWGPRGCTSQVLEAMNLQRQQFDYYHCKVNQADILTNGISVLKNKIISMVDGYINKGPLFVMLGDATLLTSENVEGVIENNIAKDFPLIFIETGFKGDSYYGVNEAMYKTIDRLVTLKQEKNNKKINIIPEVGLSPSWRGDAEEIKRIVEALGFEGNILFNRTSISDFKKCSEAAYTILVNENIGYKAAELLQSRFNIPVFKSSIFPMGLKNTDKWLKQLQEFLDIPINDEIKEKEEEIFFTITRPALREESYNTKVNIIKRNNAVIMDCANKSIKWAEVLVNELNFNKVFIFNTDNLNSNTDDMDISILNRIEFVEDFKSLIERINRDDTAIVLSSDYINQIEEINTKDKVVTTISPTVRKVTFISKPYLGYRGFINFLEDLVNKITY
ncbi:nitrogenase component 1 [Clostridium sp.]|uniref:nitrogenase component 1 n=1 Tax=Clostridium sp. TaxID=1506 RepID=UPI00260B2D71|nr:nitrogenase component 1 [Clostridium sp.]